MSNLLSELEVVVGQLRSYDDKTVAGVRLSTLSESAVNLFRTHHAEIAAAVRLVEVARRVPNWTGREIPEGCCSDAEFNDAIEAYDAAMSAREGE